MQKNNPVKPAELDRVTPFSDFEVTHTTQRSNNQKEISKGRFLFWGAVAANDCPA